MWPVLVGVCFGNMECQLKVYLLQNPVGIVCSVVFDDVLNITPFIDLCNPVYS